jgi:hypothetical protein
MTRHGGFPRYVFMDKQLIFGTLQVVISIMTKSDAECFSGG